jgi:hypothetical protein
MMMAFVVFLLEGVTLLVRHAQAGISAGVAHLSTDLTMLMRMPGAFLGAFAADLGTVFADQAGELALALHEIHGQFAELGTIGIKGDATLHHGSVLFGLAGLGACLAGEQGFLAGIDTGLV